MEKSTSSTRLQRERQKTDECLTLERGKTDELFETEKNKTEFETDKALAKSRQASDVARTQRHDQLGNSEAGIEKQDEDHVILKERLAADAAVHRERGAKSKLVSALLGRERDATDINLGSEREQSDISFLQVEDNFAKERTAHTETKAALTTRNEIVAIVSHDLKNPIGAISSCAEMLLDDPSFASLGSEARQWIEFIKRNADASLRLIRDILDMERIAEGKLQLTLAPHNISDLIRQAVDTFTHVASAKSILLRAEPASNVSASVVCDGDRIAQVLSNLIGNAIKFTPEGGTVAIRSKANENDVEISICDTGPGIPQEQQSRIFDRFAQLHNKDRRGLGLGLYISKTFVDLHQGRIWVKSALGEGSTFYLTLPKRANETFRSPTMK